MSLRVVLSAGLFACATLPCQAGPLTFCDRAPPLSASQHDRLLRFADIIKAELDRSGASVALIARGGVDLSRFGMRYSHAGVSLKESQNTPWSVRQLYFGCDERRPGLFDQGLPGFLMGSEAPAVGFVSIVLLPDREATELEQAALDNRQALQLLGATYSANAYPFSARYQNCNQWLIELLAVAWGGRSDVDASRSGAQRWLQERGYAPTIFDVGSRPLMWLSTLIPWLHSDDHPTEDTGRQLYRVSMPASIEAFVRHTVPGAVRMEFCHADRHVVIRRGWDLLPEGCQPDDGDTVIAFD